MILLVPLSASYAFIFLGGMFLGVLFLLLQGTYYAAKGTFRGLWWLFRLPFPVLMFFCMITSVITLWVAESKTVSAVSFVIFEATMVYFCIVSLQGWKKRQRELPEQQRTRLLTFKSLSNGLIVNVVLFGVISGLCYLAGKEDGFTVCIVVTFFSCVCGTAGACGVGAAKFVSLCGQPWAGE